MRINGDFHLMTIADEHMAIPVGEKANSVHGIIALSEETAFLLENMSQHKTEAQLVDILTSKYNVSTADARNDIQKILPVLFELGLIEE